MNGLISQMIEKSNFRKINPFMNVLLNENATNKYEIMNLIQLMTHWIHVSKVMSNSFIYIYLINMKYTYQLKYVTSVNFF